MVHNEKRIVSPQSSEAQAIEKSTVKTKCGELIFQFTNMMSKIKMNKG
jgi:hypothetical protein